MPWKTKKYLDFGPKIKKIHFDQLNNYDLRISEDSSVSGFRSEFSWSLNME